METLLLSTGVVALAEMGDKTQLLAFLLASRYKKPLPIILGIFVATIFNHTLAGLAGSWLAGLFSPDVLRWVLALSFVAMAIWILIPDKMDDDGIPQNKFMENGVYLELLSLPFSWLKWVTRHKLLPLLLRPATAPRSSLLPVRPWVC